MSSKGGMTSVARRTENPIVNQLNQLVKQIGKTADDSARRADYYTRKSDSLEKKNADLEKKLSFSEADLVGASALAKRLEARNADLEKRNAEIEARNAELKDVIRVGRFPEETVRGIKSLESHLISITNENLTLKKKIAELEDEMKAVILDIIDIPDN